MERRPLDHESQSPCVYLTSNHAQLVYRNRSLLALIAYVEMGRVVFVVVNPNANSKEETDSRRGSHEFLDNHQGLLAPIQAFTCSAVVGSVRPSWSTWMASSRGIGTTILPRRGFDNVPTRASQVRELTGGKAIAAMLP
jgi:hypothetical protein